MDELPEDNDAKPSAEDALRVAALPVNVRNDIRRRADASGDRADGCGDSTRGLGGFSLPSERLLGNEEAGDAGPDVDAWAWADGEIDDGAWAWNIDDDVEDDDLS